MNGATEWRLALAHEIGASYASIDNAQVVMIAGSVGRGSADRYSDVEVDVYYAEPPLETERVAAVERCGRTVELLAEDDDEWEEQMSIGGFGAHTSTFLVSTMERYLYAVVDESSLAPEAQTRLFSLQHGKTIKGEDQVKRWRARAAVYPDGLQQAMLEENLRFDRFAQAAEVLVARDDLLALYEILLETSTHLVGALLGLNRMYIPMPSYLKRLDETIGLMTLKPSDLVMRLKHCFRVQPAASVRVISALIDETLTLVDTYVAGFDTTQARTDLLRRRHAYDIRPERPG